MKREIRVIGIDDCPHTKKDNFVYVIGTIFRGSKILDGVISCKVKIDGDDATEKIAFMINNSKFKKQLKVIFLDGIAVGGFNVVDIQELYEKTKIPVIVIMRNYPNLEKIKFTLIKINMKEKIKLIEKAGNIFNLGKLHYQFYGIEKKDAEELILISKSNSEIPEAIRVSHLIGQGLIFGESKGRA
ncbi:MAG: DUF99 family protein [Candidatus Woesearchaeota archaeon]